MKNTALLVSWKGPVGQVTVNFYGCVSLINPIKLLYKRNADNTLTLMTAT